MKSSDSFLESRFVQQSSAFVVLTGAGISMAEGLPSGPAVVRSVLQVFTARLGLPREVAGKLAGNLPLEVLFQIIVDYAGQGAVSSIISSLDAKLPGAAHEWIASQLETGRCKSAYTFNFDTLQEKAIEQDVIRKKDGRSLIIEPRNGAWKLTKLHGSCDDVGVISLSEYVQGFTDEIRRSVMMDWEGRCLLVLGYGGWDVDLRVLVDDAIASKRLPKAVVWIDKHFPSSGGRSEILSDLEAQGVHCHAVTCNLNRWLDAPEEATDQSADFGVDVGRQWSALWEIEMPSIRSILAQSCLLSDCLDIAWEVLAESSNVDHTVIAGMLLDRERKYDEAMAKYASAIGDDALQESTVALCAERLFTLSAGTVDEFEKINRERLEPTLALHLDSYISSRRTDRGGLSRDGAVERFRSLPSYVDATLGVTSLHSVRLYVSILTEAARIFHEGKCFNEALELDKRAYRFAAALGDPVLTSSTSGGIGVCLMDLYEAQSGSNGRSLLGDAQYWLEKAVEGGPARVGDFNWALHTCNLGSVVSSLGQPQRGIGLISDAIAVLSEVYPNWAVSCYAFLGMAFVELFDQDAKPKHLEAGYAAIEAGRALAHKLMDFDDVYLLEETLVALDCRTKRNQDTYDKNQDTHDSPH